MKNADDPMPTAAVKRALEAIGRRRAEAEQQIAKLQRQIAADREEERLLAEIIAVRSGESSPKTAGDTRRSAARDPSQSSGTDVLVQAVFDELISAGRPIHISDLMRLLALRKVTIPGAGTQANLIVCLCRDPRFIRTSRGMYGLAEWGLEVMPPVRRLKRRRRSG